MTKMKVAIVGCGYVANGHLQAWKNIKEAEVVAVSDLNETLAKDTAKLWKIQAYYTSLSELMEHYRVEVVDICTPPSSHKLLAVQAMKAGSSILLEKPMTMTARDAEEIVESQKATGMRGGVIHNWLFESPVLRADSLVKKGRLGEITGMEIEALSTKDDSMAANRNHWSHTLPGGRFSEMLAHPIYLMRHFMGEIEVGDVQVSKTGNNAWMRSDEFCGTFKAGKKLGRAYASFNASRDAIFISLYGTKAILKLDIINAVTVLLPERKTSRFSKGYDSLRQAGQLINATAKNMTSVIFRNWLSGHEMCIRLFAQSLIKGQDPPVTIDEGYNVVKTLEGLCQRVASAEQKT